MNDQDDCPNCWEGYLESQGKGLLLRCVCCGARKQEEAEQIPKYASIEELSAKTVRDWTEATANDNRPTFESKEEEEEET